MTSIKLFKVVPKVGNLSLSGCGSAVQSRPKSHTFTVNLAVFAPSQDGGQKLWKGLLSLCLVPEGSSEEQNRGSKDIFDAFSEFEFFRSTQKIVLQNLLMNWQTEGVNSNYCSAKFEELSLEKTGDNLI